MYKLQKNRDGKFEVHELATEQILDVFSDYKVAQSYYKKLKSGLSFNGWTPSFMLIKFKEIL